MTTIRSGLLIAALLIVAAIVGTTLSIKHLDRIDASAPLGGGAEIAAAGSAANVVADRDDNQLVDQAFRQVEAVYYRPVAAQVLLEGERNGLLSYLKSRHIAGTIPDIHAADEATAEAALAPTLDFAESHYAKAVGGDADTLLTQAALRGLLRAPKDPWTIYLSPREIASMHEELNGGDFGGIGVYIEELKDERIFLLPIDSMPAAGAGVKPGDVLVSIDGKSVRGYLPDRIQTLLRGAAGTKVRVGVYPYAGRSRAPHTITIVRQNIHIPTVKAKIEDGYDYIRLVDFGATSADEVRKALLFGKSKHAKGYILDLRFNGGGYVDAAIAISSDFIPQGTIVSTIDRSGAQTDSSALGTAIGGLQPLVVLVNKYTASASEITSGALQDYHLATIIGTKTYGKGVVQTIYAMPDQGALKITTYRYVTPLGRDIQHKGITPDIVVDQLPDPALIDTPADKQLAAAKARLKQMNR